MPPEKELARQVTLVVGAGSGIGRAVVERLIREGAVVAAADLPHSRSTGCPTRSRSTDTLRQRLAEFYSARTLLRQPITPADQAEPVFLLLSQRLAQSTGQILSVDGGLAEAFLRWRLADLAQGWL